MLRKKILPSIITTLCGRRHETRCGKAARASQDLLILLRAHPINRRARLARLIIYISLTAIVSGCALDRAGTGGCPKDGEIRCNVYNVQYSFTTERNSYRFEGQCELIDDNGGSQFSDPSISFRIAGSYDRQSHEFNEVVDVQNQTNWSITGVSAVDPWLNPMVPVGISAFTGDPQGFAQSLCVSQIPPELWHIPFSRNVIIHMLSLQQLMEMKMAAASAKPPTPPPAPPCPPALVTGPPEMVMPTTGLVYKNSVQGITVELRSKCGAENVNYAQSSYRVALEHYDSNAWNEYKIDMIPMHYYPYGGSQGFKTVSLEGTGLWRIRAYHIITEKGANAATQGAYSDWVNFWIGEPHLIISEIDISKLPHSQFQKKSLKEMDALWDKRTAKTLKLDIQTPRKFTDKAAKETQGKVKPTEDQQINIFDQKPIDLSKLKRSLESWIKIKKAEIPKTSAPCPSCDKILASIRDLDTKGSSLEKEADSLIKKVEGKKVGKEEYSQVEKRAGELTREFGDLTSQRKTLVEQYNAELSKANQQRILPKPERKR